MTATTDFEGAPIESVEHAGRGFYRPSSTAKSA